MTKRQAERLIRSVNHASRQHIRRALDRALIERQDVFFPVMERADVLMGLREVERLAQATIAAARREATRLVGRGEWVAKQGKRRARATRR